jgi:integrase
VQIAPGMRRASNLTDAELTKLLTALDGESEEAGFHLMAHWFLLILLTAQRSGEVATMQWADLSLERKGSLLAGVGAGATFA